jgi:putative addiction module component (TIGR02574 family)
MKPDEIVKEIDKLALSEQLDIVEKIWDGITRNNAVLPLPEWQKAELDKRYGDFKNENLQLHDWEGVHQNLREK